MATAHRPAPVPADLAPRWATHESGPARSRVTFSCSSSGKLRVMSIGRPARPRRAAQRAVRCLRIRTPPSWATTELPRSSKAACLSRPRRSASRRASRSRRTAWAPSTLTGLRRNAGGCRSHCAPTTTSSRTSLNATRIWARSTLRRRPLRDTAGVREETVPPGRDPDVSESLERAMRRSPRGISRTALRSEHETRCIRRGAGWHADRTVKAQR